MPSLSDLLWGVLLPSVLGLGAGLIAARRGQGPRWRDALALVIATAGPLIAAIMLWSWKGFWPPSIWDRQGLILAAAGLGLAVAALLPRAGQVLGTAVIAALALVPLALRSGAWGILIPAALATALLALTLRQRAEAERGSLLAVLSVIVAWGSLVAGGFIALSAARQGQTAGMLVATVGGAAAVALLRGQVPSGLIAWAGIGLAMLLAHNHAYGDQARLGATLCLGLAPLALLIEPLIPATRRRLRMVLPAVLVLTITAIGVAVAQHRPATADTPATKSKFDVTY